MEAIINKLGKVVAFLETASKSLSTDDRPEGEVIGTALQLLKEAIDELVDQEIDDVEAGDLES